MASTCSECCYLEKTVNYPDDYGNYWCEKKGEKVQADQQECYSFTKAYNRSSSVADSYRKYSMSHNTSGGCFITTIITNILGLPDNNMYLNVLRKFRDNYMQKILI